MMSQLIAYLHLMNCLFQQKLISAKENMAIIQKFEDLLAGPYSLGQNFSHDSFGK